VGRDTDTIAKVGLKHGDMIHVANQGATMTQLPPPKKEYKVMKKTEEEIKKEQEEKEKEVPLKDSRG
jgi:hypothetical protein